MRTTAAWTLAIVLLLIVLAMTPLALWPFIPAVAIYGYMWAAQWRIERDMRKELAVMLNGK